MPQGFASNDPLIEKTEILLALVEKSIHTYRDAQLKTILPSESSVLTTATKPLTTVASSTKSVIMATTKPLAGIKQTLTNNQVSKAVGNFTDAAFINPANQLIDATKELLNAPQTKKLQRAQIKIVLINQYMSTLADTPTPSSLAKSDDILRSMIANTLDKEYKTLCASINLEETCLNDKDKQALNVFFQEINKLQQLKWLLEKLSDKHFNLHHLKRQLTTYHNHQTGTLDPDVAMNTLVNNISSFQEIVVKFNDYVNHDDIVQLFELQKRQQVLLNYANTFNGNIHQHISRMRAEKNAIMQQYRTLQQDILKAEQDIQQLTADLTNNKKPAFVKFIYHLFYPSYQPMQHAQGKYRALSDRKKRLQIELVSLHARYHGFNSKNNRFFIDYTNKMTAIKDEFNGIKNTHPPIDLAQSKKILEKQHQALLQQFITTEECFKKLFDLILSDRQPTLDLQITTTHTHLTLCDELWLSLNKMNSELNAFPELQKAIKPYLDDFAQGLNRTIHDDIIKTVNSFDRIKEHIAKLNKNRHIIETQFNHLMQFFNDVADANKTLHGMHINHYLGSYHELAKAHRDSCFGWELHDPFKNWNALDKQYQDSLRQEEYKAIFSNTQ